MQIAPPEISANYTYETYRLPLEIFLAYLEKLGVARIQDATEDDIEKYRGTLMERKLSVNSVRTYLMAVKMFFKYLEKEGVVFVNPCENVQYPKKDRRMRTCTTSRTFLDTKALTR